MGDLLLGSNLGQIGESLTALELGILDDSYNRERLV